jgi:hypothetical protein
MMENELESSSFMVSHVDNYLHLRDDSQSNYRGNEVNSTENDITAPAATTLLTRGGMKAKKNKLKQRLAKMTQESSILAEKRLQKRDASIRKIQKCWQTYSSHRDLVLLNKLVVHYQLLSLYTRKKYVERKERAVCIQHWWRSYLDKQQARLLANYTQDSKWTVRQSDLIFALVLGYRLRKQMKMCSAIVSARASLKDAWQVLEGMAQDACSAGQAAPSATSVPSEVSPHDIIKVSLISSSGSTVSPTSFGADGARLFRVWNCGVTYKIDWPFARMFAKQVLSSREVIWKNTVGSSVWCSFPPPGYWHMRCWSQLEEDVRRGQAALKSPQNTGADKKKSVVRSGQREVWGESTYEEERGDRLAPSVSSLPKQPAMQSLGSILTQKRRQKQNRLHSLESADEPAAVSAFPIRSARPSAGDDKPIAPMRGSLLGSAMADGMDSSSLTRPQTAPVSHKGSAPVPVPPVPKRKAGYGPRAHLQICVLMAEKLPATRKRVSIVLLTLL